MNGRTGLGNCKTPDEAKALLDEARRQWPRKSAEDQEHEARFIARDARIARGDPA